MGSISAVSSNICNRFPSVQADVQTINGFRVTDATSKRRLGKGPLSEVDNPHYYTRTGAVHLFYYLIKVPILMRLSVNTQYSSSPDLLDRLLAMLQKGM